MNRKGVLAALALALALALAARFTADADVFWNGGALETREPDNWSEDSYGRVGRVPTRPAVVTGATTGAGAWAWLAVSSRQAVASLRQVAPADVA